MCARSTRVYARRSTAARPRPCQRRTEKWKRCKCGQMKIPITFSTRRSVPRLPKLRHPQGGPLGPSVRGHHFAVLSTIVRHNPPNSLEREDCNLADVRRMMSKIYTDNLARSKSDSSRGIAGRGVSMQAIGPDFSDIICHDYNKFGHYKNDCTEFKAVHQQNKRRRRRQHKQRGGHQPHQPKPGGQQQQRGPGANVVLILQNHHPQRRRLPRQAGKRAQRQRPLHSSSSSERSWDLKLVGFPCQR